MMTNTGVKSRCGRHTHARQLNTPVEQQVKAGACPVISGGRLLGNQEGGGWEEVTAFTLGASRSRSLSTAEESRPTVIAVF